MITVEQIRAARGLLNWNQSELAQKSGIFKNTINNLERGVALPRLSTLEVLRKTFEQHNVEFLENTGVKLKSDDFKVQVLEGSEAVFRLMEDMVKSSGREIICNGVDEREFMAAGEKKFISLLGRIKKKKIKTRLLSKHGDNFFVEGKESYKWVSEKNFSSVPYFVYGDKFAIILWNPSQRVILVESRSIAESYKLQFNLLWEKAATPPAYVKSSYGSQLS